MNIRSILAAIAMASVGSFAALPSTMLFQGNMTVDGTAKSGTTTLVVALYDAATSGTKVWEESFANVTLVNGGFAVLLGGSKALPTFDKPLFVQLTAGGKAAATRAPLTLAPYAAMAGAIPNVRSSADTTFFDGSTLDLGQTKRIVSRSELGTRTKRALINVTTSGSGSTLELEASKTTSNSAASGGILLTDSLTTIYTQSGNQGGGSSSSIELDAQNIRVRVDTLKLTMKASVVATPTLRLVPGSYGDGPNSTIPVCDAKSAGTIIYNDGYSASATRFQGCVYLGAGVGTRYEWKALNN